MLNVIGKAEGGEWRDLTQAELGALGAAAVGVLGHADDQADAAAARRRRAGTHLATRRASSARSLVPQGAQRQRLPADQYRQAATRSPHVQAARRLNRAAGLLATSVLTDSAVEHYRGSFQNRAMYAPLVTAALSLAVSAHGVGDERTGAHAVRDAVYALAGLTGTVGTGFHVYNITKRPGGFSWLNLFYGAPLGAPFALVLSGLLGFTAERVRENEPGVTPRILGFPAGRAMAAVSVLGHAGHRRRSQPAAFPWRLPRSGDVPAGHRAARRRGIAGRHRAVPARAARAGSPGGGCA